MRLVSRFGRSPNAGKESWPPRVMLKLHHCVRRRDWGVCSPDRELCWQGDCRWKVGSSQSSLVRRSVWCRRVRHARFALLRSGAVRRGFKFIVEIHRIESEAICCPGISLAHRRRHFAEQAIQLRIGFHLGRNASPRQSARRVVE